MAINRQTVKVAAVAAGLLVAARWVVNRVGALAGLRGVI